jgi:hypothetical protein
MVRVLLSGILVRKACYYIYITHLLMVSWCPWRKWIDDDLVGVVVAFQQSVPGLRRIWSLNCGLNYVTRAIDPRQTDWFRWYSEVKPGISVSVTQRVVSLRRKK